MSETYHPAMIELRKAQIGAVLTAMDLPYASFEPMFEHFTDELMDRFELEAGIDWTSLALAATVLDPEFRWRAALLLGSSGADSDRVTAALDLADRFSPKGARIGMEVGPAGPRFHVVLRGDWARTQPYLAFLKAGVPAEALAAYDDLCGKLLVDRVGGIAVTLGPGEVRFSSAFPIAFTKGETPQVQAQVKLASDAVGAAPEQAAWMAEVVGAFAPHAENRIEASVAVTSGAFVPELTLTYPTIPARLVLKLATALGSDPHAGLKLGTFVGSTTRDEDVVDRLALTVGAGAPPRGRVAGEGVGPPALGQS